jgi:DNA-binding protein HU-beta
LFEEKRPSGRFFDAKFLRNWCLIQVCGLRYGDGKCYWVNFLTPMIVTCLIAAAGNPVAERPAFETNLLPKNPTTYPRGMSLNKTELIDEIAKAADISKASASRALEAVIDAVTSTLKEDGTVTLAGFGTFSVSARAERIGRNPRAPHQEITIKASKVPKFKPGKALKDALN